MGYRKDYFDEHKPHGGWHKCPKCGKSFRKSDMDVDHIIPQKYGGSDELWNLQAMCPHCNRSKGADLSDTPRDLARNTINRLADKFLR